MKGTDHVCSLTPSEFQQLVKDVRVIEASLGTPVKRVVTSGTSSFREILLSGDWEVRNPLLRGARLYDFL